MGDARRRRALSLPARGIRPEPMPDVQRHTLAMIDRRVGRDETGAVTFADHSAKPNTYASANLKTLYKWDGVSLRRLDKLAVKADNRAHSVSNPTT